MFLSFIIPIYNCEGYIKKNLDTILSARLSVDDFEIILVDDGSRDGSAEICKDYIEQHRNVRYLYQKNQGPATARNKGLEVAKGDYVWFVDADDSIEPKIVSVLKNLIVADPLIDMVSFSYISQYPDYKEQHEQVASSYVCSGLEYLYQQKDGSYLWNHIYKRTSIGETRFLDGVSHIEDTCFNVQTMMRFARVAVVPDVGYYYNRCNLQSISQNRQLRDRVKANADSFLVYQTLQKEMECAALEQRKYLEKELNFSVNAHLYTIMRFDNVRTLKRYVNDYQRMGLYPLKPTGNAKSDLFLWLSNRKSLMFLIMRVGISVKNKRKKYKV